MANFKRSEVTIFFVKLTNPIVYFLNAYFLMKIESFFIKNSTTAKWTSKCNVAIETALNIVRFLHFKQLLYFEFVPNDWLHDSLTLAHIPLMPTKLDWKVSPKTCFSVMFNDYVLLQQESYNLKELKFTFSIQYRLYFLLEKFLVCNSLLLLTFGGDFVC